MFKSVRLSATLAAFIALVLNLSQIAVFAVGSITFCGSLWNPAPANRGFKGPISCLLENVVRKFSGET